MAKQYGTIPDSIDQAETEARENVYRQSQWAGYSPSLQNTYSWASQARSGHIFGRLGGDSGSAIAEIIGQLTGMQLQNKYANQMDRLLMSSQMQGYSSLQSAAVDMDSLNLQRIYAKTYSRLIGGDETTARSAIDAGFRSVQGVMAHPMIRQLTGQVPWLNSAMDVLSGGGLYSQQALPFYEAAAARGFDRRGIVPLFQSLAKNIENNRGQWDTDRSDTFAGMTSAMKYGMVTKGDVFNREGGIDDIKLRETAKDVSALTKSLKGLFGAGMPVDELFKTISAISGRFTTSFRPEEMTRKLQELKYTAIATGVSPRMAASFIELAATGLESHGLSSAGSVDMAKNMANIKAMVSSQYGETGHYAGKRAEGTVIENAMGDYQNLMLSHSEKTGKAVTAFADSIGEDKLKQTVEGRKILELAKQLKPGGRLSDENSRLLLMRPNEISMAADKAIGQPGAFNAYFRTSENQPGATTSPVNYAVMTRNSAILHTLPDDPVIGDMASLFGAKNTNDRIRFSTELMNAVTANPDDKDFKPMLAGLIQKYGITDHKQLKSIMNIAEPLRQAINNTGLRDIAVRTSPEAIAKLQSQQDDATRLYDMEKLFKSQGFGRIGDSYIEQVLNAKDPKEAVYAALGLEGTGGYGQFITAVLGRDGMTKKQVDKVFSSGKHQRLLELKEKFKKLTPGTAEYKANLAEQGKLMADPDIKQMYSNMNKAAAYGEDTKPLFNAMEKLAAGIATAKTPEEIAELSELNAEVERATASLPAETVARMKAAKVDPDAGPTRADTAKFFAMRADFMRDGVIDAKEFEKLKQTEYMKKRDRLGSAAGGVGRYDDKTGEVVHERYGFSGSIADKRAGNTAQAVYINSPAVTINGPVAVTSDAPQGDNQAQGPALPTETK